ncbi:MAG: protein BatD [Candidatus Omnitrophica bacterium]|nr:protein BatD [Candidatus Omnitrophota bacterium]
MRLKGCYSVAMVLLACVCVMPLRSVALAKDIAFEASVESNRVSVGQAFQLNLRFQNVQGMPALDLPASEGFEYRYLGPLTAMSIVNGQVSSSITHQYRVLALKVGTFTIGPFSFTYNNDTFTSNQISIEVVSGPVSSGQQPQASVGDDSPQMQDLRDRIFLIIQPLKTSAYVFEQIPVSIKLYINKLQVRDIPPSPELAHEGLSLGEFKHNQFQEMLGGVAYNVIEFETSVFGFKPGEYKLGPAQITCNLMVQKQRRAASFDDFFDSDIFDDFFARFEAYPLQLKSPEVPVTILALPKEGKPESFSGAVGDFDLSASVSPTELKVGDPITIRMTVSGDGNLNTVSMPSLNTRDDFKRYEPQVKQEQDQKVFEQVIIPLSAKVKQVPEIVFHFFNPQTSQYQTITKGPFPIAVTQPEKMDQTRIVESSNETRTFSQEEKLGRDIVFIKETIGALQKKRQHLYTQALFLLAQLIPLVAYIVFLFAARHKKRLTTDKRYARQLQAPRKARAGLKACALLLENGHAQEFFDRVFVTLKEYLGDRFHIPSRSITASVVDEVLKPKGVSQEITQQVSDIFLRCDSARYAATQVTVDDMQKTLRQLEEVIDYLQRNKV